ncbi:hypothetical protein BCR32DRAFT_281949 [Anaeromyces robustus]|uniref:Uncharacterized protein n=1 Tax=Anaeromyces robustus TaxID=1754192 RepID=A0A1Y1X0F1_9FUNG|nr:hypothetical protein BCR32DRAFT_281949 [Anaeromyces robustus]|eukprot:ORX78814.1 hypothetical protein BCR32DRAFT_281949 [Anaeromyces robustus]
MTENNIRELLFVNKKYLYKLKIIMNNSSNNNNNNNNNNEIVYIILKNILTKKGIKNITIQALDDNEYFIFNEIKIKEKFEKIIKFGIAIDDVEYS